MNVREHVLVDGLPFTWCTKLDDEALRDFYRRYADRIQEPEPLADASSRTIRIPFRMAFLEFLDGVCLWTCSGTTHTVLYRSNRDWELWNAWQAEIHELRQEQAAEMAAQRHLLSTEDNYSRTKQIPH